MGESKKRAIYSANFLGMGNRISCLLMSLAIARHNDMNTILYWPENSDCRCPFSDLFVPSDAYPFAVADDFFSSFYDNCKQFDPANILNIRGQANLGAALTTQANIIVNACPIIKGEIVERTDTDIAQAFWGLKINPEVLQLSRSIPDVSDRVGIHVRRGDVSNDNHLRSYKAVREAVYFDYIDLNLDSDQKIYLAAENEEIKSAFIARYGTDKVSCLQDIPLDRNSKEGILHALAELLILSRCKFIVRPRSSFSNIARLVGKKEHVVLYN